MKEINWLSSYGNRGIYRNFIDFYRQNFMKYDELIRLYFYYSTYYLSRSALKDKETLREIEGYLTVNFSNYDIGVISFLYNNHSYYMIFRNIEEYKVCKNILEKFYENVE